MIYLLILIVGLTAYHARRAYRDYRLYRAKKIFAKYGPDMDKLTKMMAQLGTTCRAALVAASRMAQFFAAIGWTEEDIAALGDVHARISRPTPI